MDAIRKELLVARICAGMLRLNLNGRLLLLKSATREQLYIAQEVYVDHLQEAELEGVLTDAQLLDWMIDESHWDDEQQKLLDVLPKEIEEFKVKLFQATFKSNERKVIRSALEVAKQTLTRVQGKYHVWDHLSCSGAAGLARTRYLIGCSLFWPDGRPVFNYQDFWDGPSELVELAMVAAAKERLSEPAYRELARTEPWRSIWATRKSETSLLGVPAVDYTEEQRGLVGWSQLYDSVYEHHQRPPDEVVEDDDLLDGWMILQRREHDKRSTTTSADDLIESEKIRNSGEVFFMAETVEDAKKVEKFNDAAAAATKRRRMKHLAKHGEVNEADMPDSQQQIRMLHAQQYAEAMRGK